MFRLSGVGQYEDRAQHSLLAAVQLPCNRAGSQPSVNCRLNCAKALALISPFSRKNSPHVGICVSGSVPHKDFSDLYEKTSGKGASASEAHRSARSPWLSRAV